MADHTDIEWTDATWNPITGCRIVSPGCANCYAMALAGTRLKNHESRKGLTKQVNGNHVWTGEVRFNAQWLDQPLRWTKPRMIFVCAHGDLFAEGVPDEWLDQIFAVMASSKRHTFQILTKRPERMREYLLGIEREAPARLKHYIDVTMAPSRAARQALEPPMSEPAPPTPQLRALYDRALPPMRLNGFRADSRFISGVKLGEYHWRSWPLTNVWLGVSVEDQRRANERIPILLDTPAAIRWVSAEPLLGKVDIDTIWLRRDGERVTPLSNRLGDYIRPLRGNFSDSPKLDWVVAGGESGADARPMHPDWARGLRDQCAAAGVPFLFKQWGEWTEAYSEYREADGKHIEVEPDSEEGEALYNPATDRLIALDGRLFTPETLPNNTPARLVERVGKRRAGRLLDGVEHNAFPEIRRATPLQADRPSRDVPRPVRSDSVRTEE
ncbi:MAG: phage Gp37/Gp68 family protein [Rhizobium sp.]|nr:phage Gp37/Gp68 family protein [Rhizobium sp.]